MRVTVTIQSELKENIYEEFKGFLEKNLPNVRGFSGALNVSILFNDKTNDFLIHEEWVSEDHHKNYIAAISENGVLVQLASYFVGDPVIKYYYKEDL